MPKSKTETDWAWEKAKLEELPEIKAYMAFQALTPVQQSTIRKEWEEYYEKCRKSESAKIFGEMNLAMKNGDSKKMEELRARNREILENNKFIPRPKSTDPWEFGYRTIYKVYRKACQMTKTKEESW